ncbi:MAG: GntR family transcriptional regulator [Rhodospirillales bacterium]
MPDEISAMRMLPTGTSRGGRPTTVQQIYADLRHLIIDLSVSPGTVINKREIAERFGVSQTPVREALILLEEEGLVDIFPQSRTEVSHIDVQHAREAHFLRLSVEIEVARVLSQSIDDAGLAALNAWIERQETELHVDNQTAFKLGDNSFHNEMFRLAGVEGLTQIIDRRRGHYDRIRGLYLLEEERRHIVIREHRAIFAALQSGEPATAEGAIRAHLGKSLAIIDQIRNRYPDYFA